MTALVPLALLGWIAAGVVFFARLPRQQALVSAFVLGTMFLPVVTGETMDQTISLPGVKLTKLNTLSYAALLASLLFDGRRWLAFRTRWFDLPVIVLCICPLISSLTNDLGLRDGLSASLSQTIIWGVPYLMGRIYLGDPAGLRALTSGIVLGGMLYVPFCLIELRMSPQLHRLLYGFHQHQFVQTIRFNGYRPMVFMQHGLELGLWMGAATMLTSWSYWAESSSILSWASHTTRRMLWAMVVLLPVTILCRSTGAIVVCSIGFMTLIVSRATKKYIALSLLFSIAPLYIAVRASSAWDGEELVTLAEAVVGVDRAESLECRFVNDAMLVQKAREQLLFGWGGWGRSRIYDKDGNDISVTDGLWIITFGTYGLFGLTALCLTILLPAVRFAWLYPPRRWSEPNLAIAAGLAVLLGVVMIDYLLNGLLNSVYMLVAGGLAGSTLQNVAVGGAKWPAAAHRPVTLAPPIPAAAIQFRSVDYYRSPNEAMNP